MYWIHGYFMRNLQIIEHKVLDNMNAHKKVEEQAHPIPN